MMPIPAAGTFCLTDKFTAFERYEISRVISGILNRNIAYNDMGSTVLKLLCGQQAINRIIIAQRVRALAGTGGYVAHELEMPCGVNMSLHDCMGVLLTNCRVQSLYVTAFHRPPTQCNDGYQLNNYILK